MTDKGLKRHRVSLTSSSSELNTTNSSGLDCSGIVYPVFKPKRKKRKRANTCRHPSSCHSQVDMASEENQSISKALNDINGKLAHVLTKDETAFIRDIIKDTVHQMKDQILSSLTRRIEVIEGDLFDCQKQIKTLNDELSSKCAENRKLQESLKSLNLQSNKVNKSSFDQSKNDSEQYSRLNNVRIVGLPGDYLYQSSDDVTNQVVERINRQTGLRLNDNDIDIAHRLGEYKASGSRSVIVKFTRRQTKINVLKSAKRFKGTHIFINEDLTKLNAEVLASLRLKDKDASSAPGLLMGKSTSSLRVKKGERVTYEQYESWLKRPWPVKG